MYKIGLLGGLSVHSTKIYYNLINDQVSKSQGELVSANIVMNSINADQVLNLIKKKKFNELKALLLAEMKILEDAGVDYIGMACNTVHYFLDYLQKNISVPIVSIIDVVIARVKQRKFKTVSVLASKFSINNGLYNRELQAGGINTIVQDDLDVYKINKIILHLCSGIILNADRIYLVNIIKKMLSNGADGVILGCTELGLLLNSDVMLMQNIAKEDILDSASIHADLLAKLYIDSCNKNLLIKNNHNLK